MRRAPAGAAALLAASFGLSGCGAEPPPTRFLNFDAESTAGELVSGWSAFEKTPPGDTFVWAQAREAKVVLSGTAGVDRLVRFRAWPFVWEGSPPQGVTVELNDVTLGTFPLGTAPSVSTAPSPAAAWRDGENVLTFRFTYAEAPKDRIRGAGDTRTLAAAFDWIEVLPVPAPRKSVP